MIGAIRRRMMDVKRKEDLSSTEGFLFGYRLNMAGVIEHDKCCITKWYDVNEGDHLEIHANSPTSNVNTAGQYKDDISEHYIDWLYFDTPITIPDGGTQFRASFYVPDIDNCYIYNTTTSKYLFKGKAVI